MRISKLCKSNIYNHLPKEKKNYNITNRTFENRKKEKEKRKNVDQ